MDNKQTSGVGIVDPEIDEQRPADEARQARNRFWQAAERIGERNRDKDPNEELPFVASSSRRSAKSGMSGSNASPKAVVETNLFVSAILFNRGTPYALRRAWHAGAFELLLSDDHHAELADVLGRPRLVGRYNVSLEDLVKVLAGLAAATRVEPSATVPVAVRDPKDVKILAAALGGGADHLVTGDADLLVLRDHPRLGALAIVTAAEFLAILNISEP